MFTVLNEYLSRMNILTDDKIYNKINECITKTEGISKVCINVNLNRYLVDIKLSEYSVENADVYFKKFIKSVAYPYSLFYLRYNEGKLVRYKFATCREDKTGFYCELIYS